MYVIIGSGSWRKVVRKCEKEEEGKSVALYHSASKYRSNHVLNCPNLNKKEKSLSLPLLFSLSLLLPLFLSLSNFSSSYPLPFLPIKHKCCLDGRGRILLKEIFGNENFNEILIIFLNENCSVLNEIYIRSSTWQKFITFPGFKYWQIYWQFHSKNLMIFQAMSQNTEAGMMEKWYVHFFHFQARIMIS